MRPDGLFAAGTLTTADGRSFKLDIGDLVRNLRYRSGRTCPTPPRDRRAQRPPPLRMQLLSADCNVNTIGLDKAC